MDLVNRVQKYDGDDGYENEGDEDHEETEELATNSIFMTGVFSNGMEEKGSEYGVWLGGEYIIHWRR